jgi:hypothetical protein
MNKHITWNLIALAMVLPLLFAILIWQLYGLDPETYCGIVKQQGVPAGEHCYQLLLQGLKIKGWTIWLLIGTIASFVLIVLVAAVKALVSITGPNGMSLNINAKDTPPGA